MMGGKAIMGKVWQNPRADEKSKIVIGLCTFNRHGPLKEALDSLSRISLPPGVDVEFVLIDNDANGGAKYIFDAYVPEIPFLSHYFVEKNRGLANVRNRVLQEALALNATEIAMFDDDEIVSDTWLVELHKAFKQADADGAYGTVYRALPLHSPKILKKFWQGRKRLAENSIHMLGTNNCLFSVDLVRPGGKNIRFNEMFNFSGREDVVFFFDAQLKGATFCRAPEAIVIEKFSEERSTFKYLFRRWFEAGLSDVALVKYYKFGGITRTLKEVFFTIPFGFLIMPFSILCGFHRFLRIALGITSSFGWLCGLFGKTANYYLAHTD
ncbi:MAG: glycosyltransferase [Puniceicoccales bacterium]|jgi:succinoglycan biosynthesis protein ExoM|nr:glycosyltransferase [Puniceicoccales bacterium]